jgi:hypothetical protein
MGKPNPLRWVCDTDGCFNIKCRVKIQLFADFFPRNIAMGDVDGIVELEGNFLMLEWRDADYKPFIPEGQAIMYKKLALLRFCVIAIWGNTLLPRCPQWCRSSCTD